VQQISCSLKEAEISLVSTDKRFIETASQQTEHSKDTIHSVDLQCMCHTTTNWNS